MPTQYGRHAFGRFLAISVSLFLAPSSALGITFSDGVFDDSDWNKTVLTSGNGGSIGAAQVGSGGNPGEYLRVDHTINSASESESSVVLGFYERIGATYDPSVAGAITSLDFEIDYLNIATSFDGHRIGAALIQDGDLFVATTLGSFLTGTISGWQSFSVLGLDATDFALANSAADIDGSQNPDFTSGGSVIGFGFYTRNGVPPGFPDQSANDVGYDNWAVAVPEPSTALLLAAGLTGLALRRKTART